MGGIDAERPKGRGITSEPLDATALAPAWAHGAVLILMISNMRRTARVGTLDIRSKAFGLHNQSGYP